MEQMVGIIPQLILAIPFLLILVFYIMAVYISNQKYKQWPKYRTLFWVFGVSCAVSAVAGPLAKLGHVDFTAHMIGHLLLGMISPLLMVLAAPMTLILRTLNVKTARKLTRILKSRVGQIITDPVVATILNIGGLWILYTTNLYQAMHEQMALHILIHAHVFLAGYVFTLSMIYIDPNPHRTSYVYRSILLIIALAAHGILSKYIYANPPMGVETSQAEIGGMIMYYGGDTVDVIIIFILCLQWYKSSRPQNVPQSGQFIHN
ncbi:cytochrome c oxidase assembly protein [Halalkalibacter okhensis]|uniref:Membrane protein n=1 Tax=Halalkalibacter okhensis TaxID=333138 RepID=A0A0B0IDL7_9BACI|nr:cytochrome c oxidase assembly protein [Halalkalibacter okhensis]KHF38169.1 membrane protein [Halalkalibacter okhensis]